MKDLLTLQSKSDNIRGAFTVLDTAKLNGKLVTVVDDLYQSGATLHELADTLQQVGARVQGLVATKTLSSPA